MRDRRLLFATAVFAVGVPAGAAAWVSHRVGALADTLGTAAGVPVRIGAVDADLTGTIRLTDVALGNLVAADELEASISLESLLSGELGADEIRVAGPRVAVTVDANGDSDLARVARRLARPRGTSRGETGRVRRIVVSSGSLVAKIGGVGAITADDVELVPDGNGVRVITGAVRARGATGPVAIELRFERSAAELSLPQLGLGRVLAVAGTGSLTARDRTVALHDVALGRIRRGGTVAATAKLDEGGGDVRPIGVELDGNAIAVRGEHVPLRVVAGLAPKGLDVEDARATGSIAIRRSPGAIDVVTDLAVDNLRVDQRIVAPSSVPLAGAIRGSFALTTDSIAVKDAVVSLGASRWAVSGWLRRGTPASGSLDVDLATAPCAELMASLPAEIRGPLDGLALTGSLGAHIHLGIDLAAPAGDGVELTADLGGDCGVDAEAPAADIARLAEPARHQFPDGSSAKIGRGTAGWVELGRLPAHVPSAFVAAEDARFWTHHGFDLEQIAKSLEIDLREHRLARGGSTISQQLVKNEFLSQRRSFDRKLQEAILTWRLEAKLDKKAILERYLNIIELGPHIYGLGAAAHHWFGIAAPELSLRQAAFLAALTAEPTSMTRRIRRAEGLDPETASRVDVILHAMRRDGLISKDQLDLARAQPLGFAASALH